MTAWVLGLESLLVNIHNSCASNAKLLTQIVVEEKCRPEKRLVRTPDPIPPPNSLPTKLLLRRFTYQPVISDETGSSDLSEGLQTHFAQLKKLDSL